MTKEEQQYKSLLSELVAHCKECGVKVVFISPVKDGLHDYAAMNPAAAKVMGKSSPKDTIQIDETLPYEKQFKDCFHELDEWGDMSKGTKYWPAHIRALKREKKAKNIVGIIISRPKTSKLKLVRSVSEIK